MRRFVIGFLVGGLAASCLGLLLTRKASHRPAMALGHLRYPLAPARDLAPVDREGEVLMRRAAAKAFKDMTTAAARDGLNLVAISGFRDVEKQRQLFFDDAAKRGETIGERAHACAPPGFSEHHTGYSVDLADAAHRDTQLELRFKDTPAFQWLKRHAAHYHFEMSFPAGNRQHVDYEPWHWRYVGDQPSLRTFYYARLRTP